MARGVTDPTFLAVTAFTTMGKGFFDIVATMVAAGWTVMSAGDGLAAYSASDGTAIANSGSGANGANNNRAWWRLRQPGATIREIVIQLIDVTTTVNTIRMKYAYNAAFTGGSPDPDQVPSATGEVVMHGGGSDAAPTGEGTFYTSATASSYTGFADGASPYGFCFWNYDTAGTDNEAQTLRFMMDPVRQPLRNTVDPDPYVIHIAGSVSANRWTMAEMGGDTEAASIHPGWGRGHDGTYRQFPALSWIAAGDSSIRVPPTGTGDDPAADGWDTGIEKNGIPILYADGTSGLKGISTLMHLTAQYDAPSSRTTIFVDTVGGGRYFRVSEVMVPWDSSTPATFTEQDLRFWDLTTVGAAPTMTDPDPTPGDFTTDREDARLTEIGFVHTKVSESGTVLVYAHLGSDKYLVYDGSTTGDFTPMFSERSSVVISGLVYTFTLLPNGGWWGDPVITSGDFYEAVVEE